MVEQAIRTSAVSVATGLEARDNLIWICDQWAQLHARLEPMSSGGNDGVHVAPGSKPPIDLAISDLLFEIREEALQLGRVLMEETEWTPHTSTMPGLLREVALNYGHWIASDDRTALAFCDWAYDYRQKVTRALEKPPHPEFIGLCPDGTCSGDVYTKRGSGYGKCRQCGTQVEVAARREEIKELSLEWMVCPKDIPDALAIHGYNISQSGVKNWVRRKHLTPHAGLYRVGDALRLVQRNETLEAS